MNNTFDERKFSIYKQLRLTFDSKSGFNLNKEDAWEIAGIILNKTFNNKEK
jgi:uncharacterized protein YxjI